jgi:hypothetical protein
MTLETLKEKIEQFIQLDEELEQAVRKYRTSDLGGFFQADAVTIAKYAKENGLEAEIKPSECDTYPWMITVPEIKMYGVMNCKELQEIKALLDAEGLECTVQATKSRN